MRRFLLAIAGALILGALLWMLLQPDPEQDADPTGPDTTATYDEQGPVRLAGDARRRAETEEPIAAVRGVKVGKGDFGLFGTVVDERGDPVPGAWVGAYNAPFPILDFELDIAEILSQPLDLTLEPVASAVADEEGRFDLVGVYGRTIYLDARAPKRLTLSRQRVLPEHLDAEEGVLVETVAGAELSGTVLDAEGNPVAGAEVLVGPGVKYLIAAFRNGTFFMDRVFTDGAGRYHLEAVPADIALSVNAFDGPTHAGVEEFGPLPQLASGVEDVAMFEMGGLGGEVTDTEGEPVAGAMVIAVPLDLRQVIPFIRDPGGWAADTDGRGEYRFDWLPRGNFLMLAQGPQGRGAPIAARVTSDESLAPPIEIDTKALVSGRVVDIDGQPIANAKVNLQSIPQQKISSEARRNRVSTPGGVFIEAAQEILPEFLPEATFVFSNSRGEFTIPAWRRARLRVDAAGYTTHDFDLRDLEEDEKPVLVLYQPGAVEGVVIDSSRGKPLQFYLVRGELRELGEIDPDEAQRRQGGDEVVEIVHSHDGVEHEARPEEEADAEDALSPLEHSLQEGEKLIHPARSWRSNVTAMDFCESPDGRFSLTNLPPGRWKIVAQSEGFTNGEARDIVVEEGKLTRGVIIQMDLGATVRGRVVSAADREPLAGAVVSVGRGQESGFMAMLQGIDKSTAMTETDENGFFEVTGVKEGADHVNVLPDDHANTSMEILKISENEVREDVVVEVALGGTLMGTVYDRHGNPLQGRMVGAVSPQSQDFNQTATDENGAYRIDHMRSGSYFLVTAALDDESLFTGDFMKILQSSRITQAYVREGGVSEVDIVDEAAGGCKLSGVLLHEGGPVPAANLALVSMEGSSMLDFRMATSRTDESGRFEFASLAPGEYLVNVDSRVWDGKLRIAVADVPEDYMTLEVPRTKVLGRVVVEATGEPIPGASVQLVSEDDQAGGFAGMMFGGGPSRERGTTDEDGSFEFEGIAPGEYHLEVQAKNRWAQLRRGGEGEPEQDPGPPLGRVTTESFVLGNDEIKTLERVQLPIAGAVHVKLETRGGEPFEQSASARAVPAGEALEGDQEGGFFGGNRGWGRGELTIEGLDPGDYDVVVESQGHVTVVKSGVRVVQGETTDLVVTLSRGVELRVRVLDGQGQPVGGASIAVYDAEGERVNDEESFGAALGRFFGGAGDGAYPVGTFSAGSYRLEASWQGETRTVHTSLVEGAENVVEIQF